MTNSDFAKNEKNSASLIEKIKLLQEVKPDVNWVIFCRANLKMRAEMESKKELLSKDISVLEGIFAFLKWNRRPSFFAKLTYAASITLILLGAGVGLTAWAAMKSLPGSPLYQVKLAIEQVHLMTVSQTDRNKLQSEMADRRLEELKTVLSGSGSPEAKTAGVEDVVGNLQQQLMSDKDQLSSSNNSNPGQQEGSLLTAKDVVDRAKQVKKAIVEAQQSLPADINKSDLNEKLTEVVNVADNTSLQALEIMVNKADKTDADNQELLTRFNEIIKDNEAAIDAIDAKSLTTAATSTADKFPIDAVLINQSDQARDLLDKIKASLANNDFPTALDTLKALNEIVKGAEQISESNDLQAQTETNQPGGTAENSTSTQPASENQK